MQAESEEAASPISKAQLWGISVVSEQTRGAFSFSKCASLWQCSHLRRKMQCIKNGFSNATVLLSPAAAAAAAAPEVRPANYPKCKPASLDRHCPRCVSSQNGVLQRNVRQKTTRPNDNWTKTQLDQKTTGINQLDQKSNLCHPILKYHI
jgi:hypothetical protein